MERTALTTALLLGTVLSHGQNLVPNGSFEEYNECPANWSEFDGNVVGWSSCALTPDYFNECRGTSDFGVPSNWLGYQWAGSGHGYAGIITYQWNTPHVREFICAQLTTPLTIGIPVELSMRVALGGYGNYPNTAEWTCKGIGMRLTTQPFQWSQHTPFPNAAQVYLDEVLTDSMSWTSIDHSYIPDSAYQFITIGNFFADSLSSVTILESNGGFGFAYAFVDDVCISQSSTGCNTSNIISGPSMDRKWAVISPFSDRLEILLDEGSKPVQLYLLDPAGRLVSVKKSTIGQSRIEWDTSNLSDGLYVLTAFGQRGADAPVRILKVSP